MKLSHVDIQGLRQLFKEDPDQAIDSVFLLMTEITNILVENRPFLSNMHKENIDHLYPVSLSKYCHGAEVDFDEVINRVSFLRRVLS